MADFPDDISKKDRDKYLTNTCDVKNCNHEWTKHKAVKGGLFCPSCDKLCVKTPPLRKRN